MFEEDHIPFTDCIVQPISACNMSDHQPIEITITCERSPKLDDMIQEDIRESIVPKYAWKDTNFRREYGLAVQANSHRIIQNSAPTDICNILMEAGTYAYNKCFSDENKRNSYSKEWWITQLSNLKESLSRHFNVWKTYGFPRDEDIC